MGTFGVVDVSQWQVSAHEPMGSKAGKLWLEALPQGPVEGGRWLFKPRTTQHEQSQQFPKGDDWAEKIVAEVAALLNVPAAPVELARRDGVPGIISRDISSGQTLVLGNEVLFGQDPDYDRLGRRSVPGYTVGAVFGALQALGASAPHGVTGRDACSVFTGYLLLDALVANTDRHHENWGILVASQASMAPELAATFDHASSLGFLLSDEERLERLHTRDTNRMMEAYAERGHSRHFAGSPALVDLALDGLRQCPSADRDVYREGLEALDGGALEALMVAMPEERLSSLAGRFSVRLMEVNRRRLLDGLDRLS